ncbi:MAG: hypothetical protein Q9224_002323 [Gallowayella concinna]
MPELRMAHKMHTYTVIPRVLYIRRWGLKRWSLAFGKSGRVTYGLLHLFVSERAARDFLSESQSPVDPSMRIHQSLHDLRLDIRDPRYKTGGRWFPTLQPSSFLSCVFDTGIIIP